MVLLEKLWDDVVAGPQPDRGFDKPRKLQTHNLNQEGEMGKYNQSISTPQSGVTPTTPTTPTTPKTPNSARKDNNVWRSVFNPGSNINSRNIGNQIFDKPSNASSSTTVYDWLYSGETRSKHHV